MRPSCSPGSSRRMRTPGDSSSIILIILISLSSFSPCRLTFARASHLLARHINRMAKPSDRMAQARSIRSGALDGALDVQLNSRKLTGLSCSSAQSAAAWSLCPARSTFPLLVAFLIHSLAHLQAPGESCLSYNYLALHNAVWAPNEQQLSPCMRIARLGTRHRTTMTRQ